MGKDTDENPECNGLHELKLATRRLARERFREFMNPRGKPSARFPHTKTKDEQELAWRAEEQELIDGCVFDDLDGDELREVRRAAQALERLAHFAADPDTARPLRVLVEGVPFGALRAGLEELGASRPRGRPVSSRSTIADVLARPGRRWWWGTEGPSHQDLAIVSILAGNFPLNDSWVGLTPGDVLSQEADRMRKAVADLRSGRQ